jgi:hypothetical protein
MPVEKTLLIWTEQGIPASILAVALRVYELDHPGSPLRRLLTRERNWNEGRAPRESPRFATT